ncbi:MAG: hypothetical protein U0636_06010 [Phycisphaerales bacterium]
MDQRHRSAARHHRARAHLLDGFVFKTNGMTVEEQARVRAMPGV